MTSTLGLPSTVAGRMAAVLAGVRETLGAKYGFDPADERALGVWDTVGALGIPLQSFDWFNDDLRRRDRI